MDEPVKNSIWNYLIPLHYLEQVSSILERRGVEVSLTSHLRLGTPNFMVFLCEFIVTHFYRCYTNSELCKI